MASIGEKKVKGVCSLYLIDVKPGSKAYRYDVDIIRTDTNRSLTKGADDGIRYINKQICLEVMQVAYNITRRFGDPNMAYTYDQRAILFTSKPISVPNGLIQISSNEVSENVRNLTRGSDFNVTITKTVTSHEIDLTDYSQYSQQRPTLKEDRSVRTCLEMILKMDAIQRKEYVSVGLSSLFEVKDKQSVDQGLVLKSGLSQGVRIVENDGSPKAAVVLDVKRSLFYEAQPLIKSIEEVFKKYAQERAIKILNNLYEGVRISVNYTQAARHFPIRQFTNKPIKDIKFTFKGKEVSIPEYYWNQYQIKLKHVNMPGVIPDVTLARGKFLVYPSELLTIVANQRVPVEKMSAELSSIVLKANTVQPEERFRKIDETMKKLRLIHSQNPFLEQFGVSIDPKSNTVEMNVLRKPDISMGGKKVAPDEKTRWRTRDFTYTQGAEITKWAILYHESRKDLVLNFKGVLQKYANKKGVKLGNPEPLKLSDENNLNEWDKHFKFLAANEAEFVLFIGSKKDGTSSLSEGINYHHRLKLFESLYKVLTQHVASETVDACLNGKRDPRGNIIMMKNGKPLKDTATLENIFNKINCKNSGINYKPITEPIAQKFGLETGNVLVLSYDVAHPASASMRNRRLFKDPSLTSLDPSAVGLVGNVAKDPHAFVGDFFYHESRREAVNLNILKEKTKQMLEVLKKNRPKHCKPDYVFVIRDGLSEGQFAMAKKEELKEIKQGFYEYDPNYKPKFVMIIATKRHNKRFAKIDGQKIVNAEPGTVVDKKFMREDCLEFFMLSHFPIQGTAKFTQYAVLFDEIDIPEKIVKYFLLSLCYEHQIVSSAISIPAPVYQADELAKRGMNVYKELKNCYNELKNLVDLPRLPIPPEEYHMLTNRLCYLGSRLESQRVTA